MRWVNCKETARMCRHSITGIIERHLSALNKDQELIRAHTLGAFTESEVGYAQHERLHLKKISPGIQIKVVSSFTYFLCFVPTKWSGRTLGDCFLLYRSLQTRLWPHWNVAWPTLSRVRRIYSMCRCSALAELNTLRSQLLPLLPRSCDLCVEAVVSASFTRPFIIVLLFLVLFHEAAGVQG